MIKCWRWKLRIPKEEYKEAIGYLKRYNYNVTNIINMRADIISLSAVCIDGMPKSPYNVSDSVLNSVIELQENAELNRSIKEYKIVIQATQLISKDAKYIFEEMYIKGTGKQEIINNGMSERTFVRRKGELIYAVHKEIKKLA